MVKLRVAAIVLAAFLAPMALSSDCVEDQETWCGYHCGWLGNNYGWACAINDPDRCCWFSPTGDACGDSSVCDECDCEGLGGF